eukprot:6190836-Pleurochrysis_carterae.AAC.2
MNLSLARVFRSAQAEKLTRAHRIFSSVGLHAEFGGPFNSHLRILSPLSNGQHSPLFLLRSSAFCDQSQGWVL